MNYSRSLEVLKCRIRMISPRRWFPADDPSATSVAKLCILHEDLYIEYLALAADDITITFPNVPEVKGAPGLDDNGAGYRRIYFLRASLRTLGEVRGAITVLWQNKDFRDLYQKFDPAKSQKLTDYLTEIDKNLAEVKRLRDGLGGRSTQMDHSYRETSKS